MAVGMTLVILTSGIDLSVGSLLALTGAVAASIVGIEVNALVAVAAALALGAAIGAVTGVIVAKGRVQAFIATLVMMLLLRGVTMVYTNGSPVNTGFTENADLFGFALSEADMRALSLRADGTGPDVDNACPETRNFTKRDKPVLD